MCHLSRPIIPLKQILQSKICSGEQFCGKIVLALKPQVRATLCPAKCLALNLSALTFGQVCVQYFLFLSTAPETFKESFSLKGLTLVCKRLRMY